jgi:hypothetical protein
VLLYNLYSNNIPGGKVPSDCRFPGWNSSFVVDEDFIIFLMREKGEDKPQ